MTEIFSTAGSARWELDALDASPVEGAVFARLAAPAAALDVLAKEILGRWPGAVLGAAEAAELWRGVGELTWAHADGALVKVALTPAQVPDSIAFVQTPPGARGWVSAGGNSGGISWAAGAAVPALPWPAITLRGEAPLWPGTKPRFEVMRAVKLALDPNHRFPGLDD